MMFESAEEEDDNYFAPAANSKLASLFGTTMLPSSPKSNATLTYTAPKQPIAKMEESPHPSYTKIKYPSTIIVFKEVHAYKVMEDVTTPLGKCGFVLIGNDEVNIYQLLLYKEKNDILYQFKVNDQFVFSIQKNNTICVCDEKKNNVKITFDSEACVNEFSEELRKRKIPIVEGKMKPVSTASKTSNCPESSGENTKIILPKPVEAKKDCSDSENHSDSSSTKSKILTRMAKMGQKLILPKANITTSEGSDSEEENVKSIKKQGKRNKKVTIMPTNSVPNQLASSSTANTPFITASVPNQPYILANGQYIPTSMPQNQQPLYIPLSHHSMLQFNPTVDIDPTSLKCTSAHGINDPLGMFFAENRTHNSELRMNMMRLTNKVEEALNKLDTSSTGQLQLNKDSLISELQSKNMKLKSTIEEHEISIALLKAQQILLETKNQDLVQKEKDLDKVINENTKEINAYKESEIQFQNKITHLEMQIDYHKQQLKQYGEQLNKTTSSLTQVYISMSKDNIVALDDVLRKHMNLFYREICSEFASDDTYQGADIHKKIAPKVVENTHNILTILKSYSTNKTDQNVK